LNKDLDEKNLSYWSHRVCLLMLQPWGFVKNYGSQTYSILILSLSWMFTSVPFIFRKLYFPIRILSSNYSLSYHPRPQLVCHELVPGGKTIPVTNENK
jgi:hypothetical protein